jgi:hypothetical protein
VYILGYALYNALLSAYMQAFLSMSCIAQACQALVDIDMMRIAAYYMPQWCGQWHEVSGVPRETALATREVWGVTCNASVLKVLVVETL